MTEVMSIVALGLLLAGLAAAAFATHWLLEQLRMRRERARLFTLSQDLLCVLKPDGTVIHGNPAFERYFPPPAPAPAARGFSTRIWRHRPAAPARAAPAESTTCRTRKKQTPKLTHCQAMLIAGRACP